MKNSVGMAAAIVAIVKDGWQNLITGLGIQAQNKLENSQIFWDRFIESDGEQLYAASDIARKVVDELPNEAFREGYQLGFGTENSKLIKSAKQFADDIQLRDRFIEAWKLSRQFGGAAIIPIGNDVRELATPLNPQTVRRITNLLVVNRWELSYQDVDYDVRNLSFGLPKMYMLQPRSGEVEGAQNVMVHHSRVIRFEGCYLPRRMFIQNAYWHDSYLNAIQQMIRNVDTSLTGVATALQDWSVAIYKLKGLAEALAGGDDVAITKRMQIIDLCRSISRCVVVDAEHEEFEYMQRSMAGIPETLEVLISRLCAAADHLPHTKLMGEGPSGGLSANGDSERTDWYDYVSAQQENFAKPLLKDLYRRIFLTKQGPSNGQLPADFDITFNPLWQMDEKEEAEARYTTAQADQLYESMGVLDSREIRQSRFGTGKYNANTTIQRDLDDELAEKVEQGDLLALGAGGDPVEKESNGSPTDSAGQ